MAFADAFTDYSVFTEYELGFNRVRVTSVAYVGQHLVNTEHCRVPSMTRIESLPVIEVMHLKSVLASEVTCILCYRTKFLSMSI